MMRQDLFDRACVQIDAGLQRIERGRAQVGEADGAGSDERDAATYLSGQICALIGIENAPSRDRALRRRQAVVQDQRTVQVERRFIGADVDGVTRHWPRWAAVAFGAHTDRVLAFRHPQSLQCERRHKLSVESGEEGQAADDLVVPGSDRKAAVSCRRGLKEGKV